MANFILGILVGDGYGDAIMAFENALKWEDEE